MNCVGIWDDSWYFISNQNTTHMKAPVKWNSDDEEDDSTKITPFNTEPSKFESAIHKIEPSVMYRIHRWNWIIQYCCWTMPQMIAGIVLAGIYFNTICQPQSIWLISYCIFSLFDPFSLFIYFFWRTRWTLWIARLFGTFGNAFKILILLWGSWWNFSPNECRRVHEIMWISTTVLLSMGYFQVTCCFVCNFVPLLLRDTRKKMGETLPLIQEERATFRKYLI